MMYMFSTIYKPMTVSILEGNRETNYHLYAKH